MWSWALYDFANTIFSLNIVTNYFPLYIAKDLNLRDEYMPIQCRWRCLWLPLPCPLWDLFQTGEAASGCPGPSARPSSLCS